MTTINDGGPAFPMHPNSWEYGMTLRDWAWIAVVLS
jgi:hypothetical protein